MSIKQETISVNGSFSSLTIHGNKKKSWDMVWSLPTLPDNAEIISTSLSCILTVSMRIGSCTVSINGESHYGSSSVTMDLGASLISSLSVSAKGNNIFAFGTVSISSIIYTIVYSYDDGISDPPTITIQSQDVYKISGVSGRDRCTVTFTSDQVLAYWEARATVSGVTPGHGIGLLVESGTLANGVTGTVYVDDEELTNGDTNYTVSIFGQNTEGTWSDE